MIGRRPFHPAGACRQSAEQIAAPDDDGNLDTEFLNLAHLGRDLRGNGRIDSEGLLAHQGLAGEFQEDT